MALIRSMIGQKTFGSSGADKRTDFICILVLTMLKCFQDKV